MTLRVAALATAVVILAGCSTPPSAPTVPGTPVIPQASNFEGVWTIKYKLEECGGYRHCVIIKGETRTIYLHLAKVGDGYDGVVDIGRNVSVSGSVDANGVLKLTGARPAAASNDLDIAIESLTLGAVDSSVTTLGALRYTERGPSGSSFFGSGTTAGPITFAQRIGPLPDASPFSGTWNGNVAVRSCDFTGWPRCYPLDKDETDTFHLSLTAGTGGVTGNLAVGSFYLPVTGSVTGNTLRLSGTGDHPSSGVKVTYTLESGEVTVDRVGRLSGNLTLVATYEWFDGSGTWIVRYPALPLYAVARWMR